MEPSPSPANLKTRLKTSYDAIAAHYNANFTRDHDPIRFDYIARLLALLAQTGHSHVDVLELGIGGGVPGTQMLLENAAPRIRVTGNDLSTAQLDLATANLAPFVAEERLALLCGDMLALDLADASFDAVVGFYSIVHLPRDEQRVLMGKIMRWLKPGGLFLACFGEDSTEGMVMKRWLEQEEGWMFWSGWGIEGSVEMVEESGLEVLSKEVRDDVLDARFLWVIARKGGEKGRCGF